MEPTACNEDGECAAGERCHPFSGVSGGSGACLAADAPDQEILCCSDGACPAFGGAESGTCVPLLDHTTSEPTSFSVCVYGESGATLCPDPDGSVTNLDFEECLTTADGMSSVASWLEGDCDRDGCANRFDADPCMAGDVCPMPVEEDGGVKELDGGNADLDAGTIGQDSGSTGRGDAGGSGPPPGEVSYHGEGGCDCRVAGRSTTSAPWAPALGALGLGLLLGWRSRRSGRSRHESS